MSDPNDYTVGWICALATEYIAAQVFLDEEHEGPEYVSPRDNNDYTLGRIGKHNVVVAVLPYGEYGTSSAASVARDMLHSFPNVRIGLMVGIGGGAPSKNHDIRLGDVVVSTPGNGKSGVFQYDFGKTIQNQSFQRSGFLDQPPTVLRTAVNGLKAVHERKGHQLEQTIDEILEKNRRIKRKYKRLEQKTDRLYQAEYTHQATASCAITCGDDSSRLVQRSERTEDDDNPVIHYGLIASANQLMKDALVRDSLIAGEDVLCFEMEAAGLMNQFPCLVIRGICDYSDSHKNDEWHGYAAMTAAAYAKDLLCRISPTRVEAEKRMSDILAEVQSTVAGMSTGLDKLLDRQDNTEHQAILDWLTPISYSLQQSDFLGRRQDGTGEWILHSNEFREWLKCKQVLFCPGIPGAGKTIAMSIVVDHVYRTFGEANVGIAYLYCNFRREQEQKPLDLLLSLLRQLSRPSIPGAVRDLYERHSMMNTRPFVEEVLNAILSVVGTYSRTFIMIDALDECKASRSKFMSSIFHLQAKSNINIFATSRYDADIKDEFKKIGSLELEISASDEDVQRYLDAHISKLPSFVREHPSLGDKVKAAIIKAAQGMFLLATLHLDSLEDKINLRQIDCALEKLPKGSDAYDKAYGEAMDRIKGQKAGFRDLALQTLVWIACARRPLTIRALQHALATADKAPELDTLSITAVGLMVSVCAGLVTVDGGSDVIRLVHYTTQEYFERTWSIWFPGAQADITRTCLTYLSFDIFEAGVSLTYEDYEERLGTNALYGYSAQNWGHHARASSEGLVSDIVNFLEKKDSVFSCAQAMMLPLRHWSYRAIIAKPMTGMHLAAYFGLAEPTAILLQRQPDLDVQDDYFSRTPLAWAARNGHEEVARLLLDHGSSIEIKDEDGCSPLLVASKEGHDAIMKLLLDKGADIGSRDNEGSTALIHATDRAYERAASICLDNGADIESADNNGQTGLLRAASNGHIAAVKLLLDRGASVDHRETDGFNPLLWAAAKGHGEVVKLLLGSGADFESRERVYGRTPLSWAIEDGNPEVVRILLDAGADIESGDGDERTTLSHAAERGRLEVVDLLLDRGADIESRDRKGWTPLLWAVEDYSPAVKLLIDRGARVDVEAGEWTPLSKAMKRRYGGAVKLLQRAVVDTHAT